MGFVIKCTSYWLLELTGRAYYCNSECDMAFTLLLILCFHQVIGYFHEASFRTFAPPNTVTLREQALFGYSLAYQQTSKKLFISAPTADDVGKIFWADLDSGIITHMPIKVMNGVQPHQDNWLGATLQANSTYFMACAPRVSIPPEVEQHYLKKIVTYTMKGYCFYSKTVENVDYFPEVPSIYSGLFNGGINAFGWSMIVAKDVYIGSPIYTGSVMTVTKRPYTGHFEFKRLDYDSNYFNFGYSMVSGKFFSDDFVSLAISSTYGKYGQGRILFYEGDYKVWSISNGEVGSRYGATLAVAKMGGNRSALLVGAPTHADKTHSYDVGAVFLYVPNEATNTLILKRVVSGESDGAYFGASIISIGDMDGDGLDEVAIAAPYEDGGRGAVYIYTGAGLLTERSWAQKLQAPNGLETFGLSLSSIDGLGSNNCKGLAVSAPMTNNVVVYSGTPLITVVLSTNYSSLQGRSSESFTIQSRLNIEYTHGLDKVDAEIAIKIEVMHPDAKLENADADGTITHVKSLESKPTDVKWNAKILTPIDGNYEQVITYKATAYLTNINKMSPFQAQLSDRSELLSIGSIWAGDCGSKECIPDFRTNFSSSIPQPYTTGSTDVETISISLLNVGQTAYSPCIRLLVSSARILKPSLDCSWDDEGLTCKPRKPLHTGDIWGTGTIYLETKDLTSSDSDIRVSYDVYNHCNKAEKYHAENVFSLIPVSSGIIIRGSSNIEEALNLTSLDIKIGKRVEHSYTISNMGPSSWSSVGLEVEIPKRTYLEVGNNSIRVQSEMSDVSCGTRNETGEDIRALCIIDLYKNKAAKVIINMIILPDALVKANQKEKDDIKLTTNITLFLDEPKSHSITNSLHYDCQSVASWIIILAVLLALLIIIIIGYLLYRCGFLQRKKKKQLNELRKTIRRSNTSSQRSNQRGSNPTNQGERRDEERLIPPDHEESNTEHQAHV